MFETPKSQQRFNLSPECSFSERSQGISCQETPMKTSTPFHTHKKMCETPKSQQRFDLTPECSFSEGSQGIPCQETPTKTSTPFPAHEKLSDSAVKRKLDESVGYFSPKSDLETRDLPNIPISPITEEESAVNRIIEALSAKRRLNFDELREHLNSFPTADVNESMVDTSKDLSKSSTPKKRKIETSKMGKLEQHSQHSTTKMRTVNASKASTSKMKKLELSKYSILEQEVASEVKYDFSLSNKAPMPIQENTLLASYRDAVQTFREDDEKQPHDAQNVQNRKDFFDIKFRFPGYESSPTTQEHFIANSESIDLLIQEIGVYCPHCLNPTIKFELKKTVSQRFNPLMQMFCTTCDKLLGRRSAHETMTLPGHAEKTVDTLSFRFTVGLLEAGVGYTAAQTLFSSLNVPMPSKQQFHNSSKPALQVIENALSVMKNEAADIIIAHYKQMGREMEDGKMNVNVSFDGTWMTRGFASLVGAGFVVEVETGIILDFHIVNKYCNGCARISKQNLTPEEETKWKREHKEHCTANYDPKLSASSMEGQIAEILFSRSVDRNLRYTTILSDEDSSTYGRLQRLNPYADKYPIKKKNCLNHINKKVYRRLDTLTEKNHLLGKGEGKLTKKCVVDFANFYRSFVKKYNGNFTKIRRYVLASVFHYAATDEHPIHQLCPKGPDSWCRYQVASHNGVEIGPNWHQDKKNRKYSLRNEAASAVLDIMISMTTDNVLQAVGSKTQNINESIHSKLWGIVPKSKFRGITQVKFAAAKVVLVHNCGVKAANVLESLEIPLGRVLERRNTLMETSMEKSRTKKRCPKKGKQNKDEDEQYDAGAFEHAEWM